MPSKGCPKCNTAVNIEKLSCVRGDVFVLRRVSVKTRKFEKQAERAFDDVLKRKEQVKNRVAQTRTKETEQEIWSQKVFETAYCS